MSKKVCWDHVIERVRASLRARYDFSEIPLSFLSKKVDRTQPYPMEKQATYTDLEQTGLVKLQDKKIMIPYFFCGHLLLDEWLLSL
jgi:hypothetical protein